MSKGDTAQSRLGKLLMDATDKRRSMQRRTAFMQCCWWWLCALLGAVVVDSLWPLSETGRMLVAWYLLVFMLVLCVRVYFAGRGKGKGGRPSSTSQNGTRQTDESRALWQTAAVLETHHGLHDNPMINALWLSQQAEAKGADESSSSSLTQALRERSIQAGMATATKTDKTAAADRQALLFHRYRLLAVLGLWLVLIVLMPRLAYAGLHRVVNPWGDYPPFSLTRFHVDLPDGPVYQGSSVKVDITLAGQLPESLDWVEFMQGVDVNGHIHMLEVRRIPLSSISRGKYHHRLRDVNQDVFFRLESEQGRSDRMTIKVIPAPPKPVFDEKTLDPAAEIKPADPIVPTTTSPEAKKPDYSFASSNPEVKAVSQAQKELADVAQDLADAAGRMEKLLQDQAIASGGGQPLTPQQQAQADEVARMQEEFKEKAAKLREQVDKALANNQPDSLPQTKEDRDRLWETDAILKSLDTPSELSPTSLTKPTVQSMAECMGGLCNSALSDQKKLSRNENSKAGPGSGPSFEVTDSGTTSHDGDEKPKDPSGPGDVVKSGVYYENNPTPGSPAAVTQARGRDVPEQYRPKVQQYFDRINEDQSLPRE